MSRASAAKLESGGRGVKQEEEILPKILRDGRQDFGYWMLDARYWMLVTGCWLLEAGRKKPKKRKWRRTARPGIGSTADARGWEGSRRTVWSSARRPQRGRLQQDSSAVAGVGDPGREHPARGKAKSGAASRSSSSVVLESQTSRTTTTSDAIRTASGIQYRVSMIQDRATSNQHPSAYAFDCRRYSDSRRSPCWTASTPMPASNRRGSTWRLIAAAPLRPVL